ncbi:hypothetical protein GCM10023203_05900 [Actinomycetospora straminea]|uniref:Uncharacterized protein n=1 Tax=Actinomycetospora straminea TaxID=663607 RepID=A0ABP9DZN5_9PSEU
MTEVGEQRERAGDHRADRAHHRHQRGDGEREGEAPAIVGGSAVTVSMTHGADHTCTDVHAMRDVPHASGTPGQSTPHGRHTRS